MPVLKLRAPGGRRWTLKEVVQGHPLGHPSHPILVHYPTALSLAVVGFDVFVRARSGDAPMVRAAAYLALATIASALVAAVPGLVDWWGMVAGSRKRRTATVHLWWQTGAIVLLAVSAAVRWPGRFDQLPSWLATACAAAAALAILVGNFFGGVLVYRMAMRVSTGARDGD